MMAVSGRWRCLIALVVVIVVAAVAAVGAVILAPETVRMLLTKAGGRADLLAKLFAPTLPPATKIEKAYWLSQNWSARDRYWFHHMSQGTATFPVPYEWFLALERPELSLFGHPGYIKDEEYLRRFGFIPSPSPDRLQRGGGAFGYHSEGPVSAREGTAGDRATAYPDNADGLPVGFAKLKKGIDPATGEEYPEQLGFTCSACHTGHIEYKNVSIRFDGAGAMINLGDLEKTVALSIFYTLNVPFRFDRFADRVSKSNSRWSDKNQLKEEMESVFNKIRTQTGWESEILARTKVDHLEEGFGRLDALNRIGNQVFFEDMLPAEGSARTQTRPRAGQKDAPPPLPEHLTANFARRDAPVSFPPLWDVPWFLWAQYDGSISAELIRNAGEALGVNAKFNMTVHSDEKRPLFRSSVEIGNIDWIEQMLRGPDPFGDNSGGTPSFKGLTAPKWTEVAAIFKDDGAWQIDPAKVRQGRGLYREFCVECHRGPVNDAEFDKEWPDLSFWRTENPDREDKNWIKIGDRQYFNVVQRPVTHIGTDRQQARVLTERRVKLPSSLALNPVNDLNSQGCKLSKDDGLDSSFAVALMAVVEKAIQRWFEDNGTPAQTQAEMRGPRRNCPNPRVFTTVRPADAARAGDAAVAEAGSGNAKEDIAVIVPHYRARPLDGVWATAPYLHNGSVPTLHDMLTPQHERPAAFCVGNRAFDPGRVGLPKDSVIDLNAKDGGVCPTGLTRLDTRQVGNSNLGHSFEGTEADKTKLPLGVIGRGLKPEERDALVEYLKTL
jgi:RoxA-like, cytochrome c-like